MHLNLNIDLLKYFYEVAKFKNITKASEKLLVSQSAISKAIKNLENQLDCKLFIRSKKGVELTKAGKILYNSTEKIINILNNDLEKISSTKTINILVGKILADKVLVPYISLFRKKYPKTCINFKCTDIDGILEMIKNHEADLAVGYYLENLDDNYNQIEISKGLHPIFVCNSSYKSLINKKVEIREIEKYPFIISAKGATTHKYALDVFDKYNLNIKPTMEVLGTSLIEQFVKKGLGISILTEEFITEELNNKELFKIDIKEKIETRNLYILTYKDTKITKELEYLIKILTDENINNRINWHYNIPLRDTIINLINITQHPIKESNNTQEKFKRAEKSSLLLISNSLNLSFLLLKNMI